MNEKQLRNYSNHIKGKKTGRHQLDVSELVLT